LAAIAIASFLPIVFFKKNLCWFGALIISAAALILFWQNKKIRLGALLGLFLFLGIWRYGLSLPAETSDKIWHYNGKRVKISGIIIKEPDARVSQIKYTLSAKKLISLDQIDFSKKGAINSASISGKILISANSFPEYNYGDEIEIEGKLEKIEEFNGFAYDRYLSRYDIYSACYYPKIKLLKNNQGSRLFKNILIFKKKAEEAIKRGLGEPEAALTEAIILGKQRNIPDNLSEKFSQTGLSHIMAISGMNITIFAAMLTSVFMVFGLNRRISFYFVLIFLFSYVILIGAPASAVRAGAMGFLAAWALYLGRLNKMENSIALAAAIMLFINPKLLRDDISFQLSFSALLGIIYAYPIFEKLSERIFKNKNIFISILIFKAAYDSLAITLAAQIFTLPFLAYNFSRISLIAPIANLLVLWTQPIFMVTATLGIIFSMLIKGAAIFLFFPSQIILKYIIIITENLAEFPYAALEIDLYSISGFYLAAYYLTAIYSIAAARRRLNF
jgi:competence protein ComEC